MLASYRQGALAQRLQITQSLRTSPVHHVRRPRLQTTVSVNALLSGLLDRASGGRAAVKRQADELFQLLTLEGGDAERISELVDTLMESQLPFQERLLGGGPWEVRGAVLQRQGGEERERVFKCFPWWAWHKQGWVAGVQSVSRAHVT